MKIGILTIGDEILLGQTIDSNSAWIANQLYELQIQVGQILSVSDENQDIINGIDTLLSKYDFCISTGGLGPTKDDITKKAVAEYFNLKMQFSEDTFQRIEQIAKKRGFKLTPGHKNQCYMPTGAILYENALGTAPGMRIEKNGKTLVSLPGIPYEMKGLMTDHILPHLKNLSPAKLKKETLTIVGHGETSIEEVVEPLLENTSVAVAYLPSPGVVRLRLSVSETANIEVKELNTVLNQVRNNFANDILLSNHQSLEEELGYLLNQKKQTIACAESCTGGFLSHCITLVPGSSAYLLGSIISYSNQMKIDHLHVREDTLFRYGAVSKQTAKEMLLGVLHQVKSDFAMAITGIAGPGGGTKDKPVGTVYIAVGDKHQQNVQRFLFTKNRKINIQYSAVYAMIMMRKFLLNK